MTDPTIIVIIYGIMSFFLAGVGLYSLKKGFDLIIHNQSNEESSTIEIGKVKVSLGSLGALVMLTSFLWGYSAAHVLPKYKDKDVNISIQEKSINKNRIDIDKLMEKDKK